MSARMIMSVLVAVACPLGAGAQTLDFEEFDLGPSTFLDVPETLVFSDVGGSGVTVTIVGSADNRVYDLDRYSSDPYAYGQALIDWPWPSGSNPAGTTILFDRPVLAVSLDAGDFGSDDDSPLMITAFDVADVFVGSDSVAWDDTRTAPFATLRVDASGIRKVVYSSGGAYANSTFIDNITFQPVPGPATLALLGVGTIGLIRRRRRAAAADDMHTLKREGSEGSSGSRSR